VGADLPVLFTALAGAAFLIVVMRWVFSTSRPATGRPQRGPNADLGLLRPALSRGSRAAAIEAKNRLSSHGIRCSLSRIDHEHYDVLVFAPDLDHARELLSSD
jgi:hypothetical protein